MKEYGSSIQKLVDNIVTIEDREKRTRYAYMLVELMRQIHPNMKEGQDYYNKLWDDLYIMSDFALDVDSPYPPPSEEALGKKPQRVPYNTHPTLKFRHFGYNVDLLVSKAIALDDADERHAFVSYLVRLLRTFYQTWNKEGVEDDTIYQSLLDLSKGKLQADIDLIREQGLIESTPRERAGEISVQPQRLSSNQNRHRQGNFYGRGQGGNYNRNKGGNNNRNNSNNNNRNQGSNNSNRNDRRRR